MGDRDLTVVGYPWAPLLAVAVVLLASGLFSKLPAVWFRWKGRDDARQ